MSNKEISEKLKKRHKEMHYEFLSQFAYLETLIAYIIASCFANNREQKVDLTDNLISELSARQKISVFCSLLKSKKLVIPELVNEKQKILDKLIRFRNTFAHSYFVEKDNQEDRSCVRLAYLHNSQGRGFTKEIIFNDYEDKLKMIEDLISFSNDIISENKFYYKEHKDTE